jgi:uncharacterized protein YecE (DUF72 family)
MPTPTIRAGIGGWTFEPWREGVFYPAGWPKARELEYAASRLKTIEVNGTYYSLQSPKTFAAWGAAAPEGFVFAIKGSRFVTHRRVLATAGEAVQKFAASGLAELGGKLGPVVWQFAPTKAFDAADFGAFLGLLPRQVGGVALRHAVEVRHASFAVPAFVELARQHGVAIVFAESDEAATGYPRIADLTSSFVYLRVMRAEAAQPAGYGAGELDAMAACAKAWRDGGSPAGVPLVHPQAAPVQPREVFVQFIASAKERNPAAAMAFQQRVG